MSGSVVLIVCQQGPEGMGDIEITSFLVSAYDFYSRVVKDR